MTRTFETYAARLARADYRGTFWTADLEQGQRVAVSAIVQLYYEVENPGGFAGYIADTLREARRVR